MKIMCISDIHGNIECLEKAIEKFEEEDAEKLRYYILLDELF